MLADKFPNPYFVFSQHTYLEIFDKNVNKGTEVLEMIENTELARGDYGFWAISGMILKC